MGLRSKSWWRKSSSSSPWYHQNIKAPESWWDLLFIPCCRSRALIPAAVDQEQGRNISRVWRSIWATRSARGTSEPSRPMMTMMLRKNAKGHWKWSYAEWAIFFLLSIVILMSWERGSQGYDCCRQDPWICQHPQIIHGIANIPKS